MNMVKANKLGRLTVTVTFKVLINLERLGGEGEQRLGSGSPPTMARGPKINRRCLRGHLQMAVRVRPSVSANLGDARKKSSLSRRLPVHRYLDDRAEKYIASVANNSHMW